MENFKTVIDDATYDVKYEVESAIGGSEFKVTVNDSDTFDFSSTITDLNKGLSVHGSQIQTGKYSPLFAEISEKVMEHYRGIPLPSAK